MSFTTITPHSFLANVTASTVTDWYPIDYRHPGENLRGVVGSKTATSADTILLELRTLVVSAGTNSSNAPVVTTVADVITTATSWDQTVTTFSAVIQGPFTHVRVRKTGASAAATVVGLV